MLFAAIAAIGISVSGALNFSVQYFITLAIAGIVAAIVNQHQFTVSETRTKMTVEELAAFWRIVWLGIPGGVFLVVIASSAKFLITRKDAEKQFFGVFLNAAATLAAGFAFYFSLQDFGGFTETKLAENPAAIGALLLAAGLMVLTHYITYRRSVGFIGKELSALETGALLHDIGKLAVPDNILNKPGRLTPAEMEKMKIHACVGASTLEKVGFNYPVVPTAKHHHEMWDGTGYPEGLKGENIPLTSRILAVADVFDSLRGARPFRPPVSRDDARKQLLHGAGTQFDPKVVDVFLRNMRRFEERIKREGLAYSFSSENGNLYTGDQPTQQGFVQQIKSANREVFTLYELAKVFSASLSLEDTLSLFVKKIGELIPFDSCAVFLMNDDG